MMRTVIVTFMLAAAALAGEQPCTVTTASGSRLCSAQDEAVFRRQQAHAAEYLAKFHARQEEARAAKERMRQIQKAAAEFRRRWDAANKQWDAAVADIRRRSAEPEQPAKR